MAFNTIKPENLVGRQVYFKMSAKRLAASSIKDLTPNKLYTITELYCSTTYLFYIKDDVGYPVLIPMDGSVCGHLALLTHWILKRRAK